MAVDQEQWGQTWGVAPARVPAVIHRLRRSLAQRFNLSPEARIPLWSPAGAGRWLLEHSGAPMAALPAEVRELIHATTPQHRLELYPTLEPVIPALYYYDGRGMYLALLDQEIGQGPVRRVVGGAVEGADRGRYEVRYRVPRDWHSVGLLPEARPQGGWWWPGLQEYEGETWCDAAEARLAVKHGWEVEVKQKILLTKARPLAAWGGRLATLYQWSRQEHDSEDLAGCYRAIALYTIGALHSLGTYTATRFVREGDEAQIPAAADVALAPGGYQVTEREAVRARWSPRFSHPEWSAAVWALARLRVTRQLLALPRSTIRGVVGDAIYLDAVDAAQWPDDGQLGRFRRKGYLPGPLLPPATMIGLRALGREAEHAAG